MAFLSIALLKVEESVENETVSHKWCFGSSPQMKQQTTTLSISCKQTHLVAMRLWWIKTRCGRLWNQLEMDEPHHLIASCVCCSSVYLWEPALFVSEIHTLTSYLWLCGACTWIFVAVGVGCVWYGHQIKQCSSKSLLLAWSQPVGISLRNQGEFRHFSPHFFPLKVPAVGRFQLCVVDTWGLDVLKDGGWWWSRASCSC